MTRMVRFHELSSPASRAAFRPAIDRIFSLEEIVAAHRCLEANEQVGKVVVVP